MEEIVEVNVKPFVSVALPLGVLTVTSNGPTTVLPANVAVICVGLRTDTLLTGLGKLKATEAPWVKPLPVIVTFVDAVYGPELGTTLVIDGGALTYVNPFVSVALWPSGFVNTTSTDPAACGGVVVVTCDELTQLNPTELPPMVNVAGGLALLTKFEPAIVTDVPPAGGPLDGDIDVSVGAGPEVNMNPLGSKPDRPLSRTRTSTTPAACAGVVARIVFGSTTDALVANAPVPNSTETLGKRKSLPEIVTTVLPVIGPEVGVIDDMFG